MTVACRSQAGSGSGPVIVIVDGVSSVGAAPQFTYLPPPLVTDISRPFGSISGGIGTAAFLLFVAVMISWIN